jgi:hypothetical protein
MSATGTDQFDKIRLGELDPNAVVWRYFTLPKFLSLLLTSALWLSKLEILIDKFEGTAPLPIQAMMQAYIEKMAGKNETLREQLAGVFRRNEADGREMLVASCWYVGESESQRMWDEYVGNGEGILIRTTARNLANSLARHHDQLHLGKVRYVDFASYSEMSPYEANQAHVRTFLKNAHYDWESEVRLVTMNVVVPGCLNPDGSPPNERQKAGYVYSGGRNGIFVQVKLPVLVQEVRSAPTASDWHHNLIRLLMTRALPNCPVVRSELYR